MDRYAAVALALILAGGLALAKPTAKKTAELSLKATPALHVRSIDLQKRQVLIEVGGLPKVPPGNLFTFSDERGRHFVAVNVACDEPFPSGTRACELEIPAGYERHKIVGLLLHLHGLHGRPIEAEPVEVARAWSAGVNVPVNDSGNDNANANGHVDGGAPADGASRDSSLLHARP